MEAVRATGTEWLHSHTTAYALFGDYPSDSTGPTAPVELTWGHTKDHRPDLKQIMAGVTMDAEGCVLAGSSQSVNVPGNRPSQSIPIARICVMVSSDIMAESAI